MLTGGGPVAKETNMANRKGWGAIAAAVALLVMCAVPAAASDERALLGARAAWERAWAWLRDASQALLPRAQFRSEHAASDAGGTIDPNGQPSPPSPTDTSGGPGPQGDAGGTIDPDG
jgi:hypothetical protein